MSCRPCIWTLPSSVKSLYVADLTNDESLHRAAFQLISDAAQRADNVGVDEFTPDWLRLTLNKAEVAITLSEAEDQPQKPGEPGRLLGLMIVTESRFCRSANPSSCQLFVITAKELGGRQTRRDLVHLGTSLVAEATRPYTECMVEVFATCLEHVLALRDEGFNITACVPEAGILSGHTGYIDSYVMYKTIYIDQVSTLMLTDVAENTANEEIEFTLRQLPDYLPCRWKIDNGPTQTIVRPLRRDEVADNYAAIKESVKSGVGYGYDQFSGLSSFITTHVDDHYNIVFELEHSSERGVSSESVASKDNKAARTSVVCYLNFGPSVYRRSQRRDTVIASGSIVILPEYQRRHWTSNMMRVAMGILADCGFHYLVTDSAVSNLPGILAARRFGSLMCGIIPHGKYFRDHGWVDKYMVAAPLKHEDWAYARQVQKAKI